MIKLNAVLRLMIASCGYTTGPLCTKNVVFVAKMKEPPARLKSSCFRNLPVSFLQNPTN